MDGVGGLTPSVPARPGGSMAEESRLEEIVLQGDPVGGGIASLPNRASLLSLVAGAGVDEACRKLIEICYELPLLTAS